MSGLTRERLFEMEELEISLTVAEVIFEAKVIGKEGDPHSKLLVGWFGKEAWKPMSGARWQNAIWRNSEEEAWLDCPKYAENPKYAWAVEETLKWLASTEGRNLTGLIENYMEELIQLVGSSGFDLVHATPEQRCKAALLAFIRN